jgi:hypothetical protein
VRLRYGRVSQVWVRISGMGVHLRYRSYISDINMYLRYRSYISGIGVHLKYRRASQIWPYILGMAVSLRYGCVSQVWARISGIGRASQIWACISDIDVYLRYRSDITSGARPRQAFNVVPRIWCAGTSRDVGDHVTPPD